MKINLFALVSAFLLLSFDGQAQDNLLTPMDIARLQSIRFPVISPDGKLAAYQLIVPADPLKENKIPSNHLYAIDLATGKSIALITNRSVSVPAFRPRTNNVTFLSKNSETKLVSLFEISSSGGYL